VRVFSGDLPNNWDLPSGEMSVRRFRVEALIAGAWTKLAETDRPAPNYYDCPTSIGPYTHHAVVAFAPQKIDALRLVLLEGNDTGRRQDPPEEVPLAKRLALIREVEIFSTDAALGLPIVPFRRLVETDWTLAAYLNRAQASLLVLPRPRVKEPLELEIQFREQQTGAVPVPPMHCTIRPEPRPQRFPVEIGVWPDGEYITTIRQLRADGKDAGQLQRKLIKQTIAEPHAPAEPIAVRGLSVIPFDNWYFAEAQGLRRELHPAEQFPVVDKPFASGRIRMDGLSLKLDAAGQFVVEVEDMDRFGRDPQRHTLRSPDGVQWRLDRAPNKPFSLLDDRPQARVYAASAKNGPTVNRAKPGPGVPKLPDDHQAKWKYQDKNAPIAAQPHRFYDPAKDGPVNLRQVTVRHARHYPPRWGHVDIPRYTVWPVWKKAADDYVILTREPLTHHIASFGDDLLDAHTAGDGWWGGYPEISPDGKTIYWTQFRMIARFPPFRVAYDLARGAERHVVVWSSHDGVNWRQTFTTLPEESDEIGTQHYGGMMLPLEGGRLWLCYVWTYKAARQQMCLDLAYSRDRIRWHRLAGPTFSPNGPLGNWNYGFATTVGGPEVDRGPWSYRLAGREAFCPHFFFEIFNRPLELDTIANPQWIAKRFEGLGLRQMPNWPDYGSFDALAANLRQIGATGTGRSVGLLRYRKNGWVSLRPEGHRPATLVTKLLDTGGRLSLNAQTAASGSIVVEVLDADGKPLPDYSGIKAARFTGNAIDARLTWGSSATALPAGPLRLRLTLDRADLYALNF
jgi:hypothetical protein